MKSTKRRALSAWVAAITIAGAAPALAAGTSASDVKSSPSPAARAARPRASLRIDVPSAKAWVGQRVPFTVTAHFRDVESVMLEGAPQIVSNAVVTSELSRDPKQSTQLVDGVPTLTVSWRGTLTPSTAGAVDLAVKMPVRLRYREVAARAPAARGGDDPSDAFGGDPFAGFGLGMDDDIDALFDRMRARMRRRMEHTEGPLRDRAMTLDARAPSVEARALPAAGRPDSFTGAVGTFDLEASASANVGRVSEPIVVRTVVSGDLDLDRVELAGIAASDAWKVYPPRVVPEDPAAPGAKGRERKVFEQVLVPQKDGELTIPPIELSTFDPASSTYVTKTSEPIAVRVAPSGAGHATSVAANDRAAAAAAAPAAPPPSDPVQVPSLRLVGYSAFPPLALVALAALVKSARDRRARSTTRRAMRRAAQNGSPSEFLANARRLVTETLAKRWRIPADAVTAQSIRERLGERGEPLANVVVAADAARFGRGGIEGGDLSAMSGSIESALRGAS